MHLVRRFLLLLAAFAAVGSLAENDAEAAILEDGSVIHDLDDTQTKTANRRVHKRVRTGTASAVGAAAAPGEVHNESVSILQEVSAHGGLQLEQVEPEHSEHAAHLARLQEAHSSFLETISGLERSSGESYAHTSNLVALTEDMIRELRVARGRSADGPAPKEKEMSRGQKIKQGFKTCPEWLPQRIWEYYQGAIKYANVAVGVVSFASPGMNLGLLKLAFMGYVSDDEDDYPYLPMGTGFVDFGTLDAQQQQNGR